MSFSLRSHGRVILLGAGLVVALLVLVVQQTQSGQGLQALPLYDFVEYWAAGQLNLRGQNPYDAVLIEQLQRPYLAPPGDPILMWNPPWTLPLVMPLGLLDIHTAHVLWFLVHLLALIGGADLLWRLYRGRDELRWLAWLLALVFVPSCMALLAGQISPFLLLGAAGFLAALRARRDFLAGAATVLLAIKPHLAFLFWLALLLWAVRERRWSLLAGGAITGLAATALALSFNPAVLQHYALTTATPPAQYRSPTLGTLLRLAVGEGPFRLQFLALLPGLIWFVPYALKKRREWDWNRELPVLLFVSFLTAPYGAWPFDLVLLLVPVIGLAARLTDETFPVSWTARLAGLIGFLLFEGLAALLLVREVEYLWFIWMTPALLALYLGVLAGARRTEQPQPSPGLAGSTPGR